MSNEAGDRDLDERPVVLAVDDQERVCQAIELWLGEEYQIEMALSGSEALERMSDQVDVVLLDRHMPGMSGSEVLDKIRERGYDCRIAMVTAVDPDFDIIDMPFDDYLSKPVNRQDLREVIERLLDVDRYDDRMAELYTVSKKIASLETEKTQPQLDESGEYRDLVALQEELESEITRLDESVDDTEGQSLFGLADITDDA